MYKNVHYCLFTFFFVQLRSNNVQYYIPIDWSQHGIAYKYRPGSEMVIHNI
jgi:hypothetical protein